MRTTLAACLVLGMAAGCNCGELARPGEEDGGGDGVQEDGGHTGTGDGGSTACLEGVQSIALAGPTSPILIGAAPSPLSFNATATLADGSTADVTSRLEWSARRNDQTPPGTFSGPGTYQPAAGTGGLVTISATDGCRSAETTVALRLESTFQDPGPGVTSRFDGTVVTTAGAKTPVLVYPSDQTRFPRNIYKVLFQWRKSGNEYFRLTFEGPYSTVVVYSDGANLQCKAVATTAGCTETDTAIWQAVAGSNAGEVVTVTLDAVSAGDANVYRAAPIRIGFSRQDVKGAIFYWSTTAAGVRRASVSDQEPEGYVVAKPTPTLLPNGNGEVKCVACHTVSRSGKKLFGFTQAAKTGGFVYDVTLDPPPTPLITTEITTAKGFGTFRPDDERVVATVGSLLKEFRTDGGTLVTTLPLAAGTNPDWSPTGEELAYSDRSGDSPGSANLKTISYADGAWDAGSIRTLVPSGGLTNLFPSYSPDGRYIAYARGKGGHGDKTLQLWLVMADGSEPPVELVTANRIVNSQVTLGQHENNMPTWAPPGDMEWIAFNSVRPYGVVYPNGGTQQIWVAGIDRSRLGQKLEDGGMVDPSYPAFRFAFQGLAENNHRAFWTLDVREPPDGGPVCAGLGSVCGAGVTCCSGLTCESAEIGQSCQEPTSGACLAEGEPCSQTSGAACCQGKVCDVGEDGGGAMCRGVIIN